MTAVDSTLQCGGFYVVKRERQRIQTQDINFSHLFIFSSLKETKTSYREKVDVSADEIKKNLVFEKYKKYIDRRS